MSIMSHSYVNKEREYTHIAALKNVCQVPPWSIQSVVHTVALFSRSPWSCTAVRALLSKDVLQGLCSRPWLVKKVLISWTMIFSGVDTSTGTPASSSSHFRFLSCCCCCCWPCFCDCAPGRLSVWLCNAVAMQEYFWSVNSSQTCNGDNTINTANKKFGNFHRCQCLSTLEMWTKVEWHAFIGKSSSGRARLVEAQVQIKAPMVV